MKQYYPASLCRNGILGGAVIADDESITYKTGKLTVPPGWRNFRMEYERIRSFSKKWVLCFPVFSITMTDGETYKFIIFRPKRFHALLSEKVKQ